jgi:hypothetical protein
VVPDEYAQQKIVLQINQVREKCGENPNGVIIILSFRLTFLFTIYIIIYNVFHCFRLPLLVFFFYSHLIASIHHQILAPKVAARLGLTAASVTRASRSDDLPQCTILIATPPVLLALQEKKKLMDPIQWLIFDEGEMLISCYFT